MRIAPAALTPVELQHQLSHDTIIDIIPHPRFRYNMLCATARRKLDEANISGCIRYSGALEQVHGSWQRRGSVAWSAPEGVIPMFFAQMSVPAAGM